MKLASASTIYRYSILLLSIIIASPLYAAALVVLIPIFGCWLYYKDYKRVIPFITQPQIMWPVLLYIIVFTGFFFSNNYKSALSSLSTEIPYLLFPVIIVTSSIVDKKLIKQAGNLIVAVVSASLIIAIAYALFDLYRTGEKQILIEQSIYNKWEWYGLTRIFHNWHPTYVAVCANLAIAIQIYNLRYTPALHKKRNLLITCIVFIFLTACIVLLNSMVGLISYFCVLFYIFFQILNYFRIKRLYRLLLLSTIVIMAAGFYYFNPLNIQKINDLKTGRFEVTDVQSKRNLLTIRLAKWDAYLAVIKDHWLFGTTEGDIKIIRNNVYREKGYEDLYHAGYNAHNQYLETFAMFGLPGFVIFMCMLAAPLVSKKYHPYYIPFIIITALTFLTESLLQRQQGILFFMFLYALFTNPKSFIDQKAATSPH